MRFELTERNINRIDHDIDALLTCKRYLGNLREIDAAVVTLNQERQGEIDNLCREDFLSYEDCRAKMEPLVGKELGGADQQALLQTIKEFFGRKAPVVGKNSHGLNAWLKELNVEATWAEVPDHDWAILTITGFGFYKKTPGVPLM